MARQFACQWLSLCLTLSSLMGLIEALSFTKQPNDTSVFLGSEQVVLECKVDDTSVQPYWFKEGSAIKEDFNKYTVTSIGLRIKPVLKSDAGIYHCKAGSLTSRVATLTVEYICKDKFIIGHPDVVFLGDNFNLTCDCPAVPTPSYTWQKDNRPLLSFTGKQLVITNAQKRKDDGKYVCIVNSGAQEATSLPHNLDVFNCTPPKIDHPPDRETPFLVAKPLTIRCDAFGDPKPDVNWYHGSNKALKNTSHIQILSNGALHFTAIQADDAGEYQCYAINTCSHSETYTTDLVRAKIGRFNPMKYVLSRVDNPVSITCDPPSNSFPLIKNVTWQMGNRSPLPIDPKFKVIGNTLQIDQAQRADSGTYKCVAENVAGKKSVDVKVIVAIYPQVMLDPVNKTIIEGESVKLECKFSGDPKPTITWEKSGKSFSDNTNTNIKYSGNGSVLTIHNAESDQSGKYRCSAKLKHVTERTKEAMLFVKEKILLENFGSQKFDEGKDAKLTCRVVAGAKPYHIRWAKQGVDGGLLPHMKVVRDSMLIIDKVKMTDSGNYTCHVSNSFSNASLTFGVHIYDFAKIVLKPDNLSVMESDSALFNCKATGIPKPGIVWYTRGPERWRAIDNSSRIEIFPNGSLLLRNVRKEDEALYRCIAGNAGYIEEGVAYLKVGSAPSGNPAPTGISDEHETDNMGKTVGIAVGCAGAYIILVVGLMIYCRGRRARQAKNKLLVNGEDMPLKPADNVDDVEEVKAPEAPNAPQYPRENLETLRTLGSGTYGNVFLAKASEISEGESSSIVVVQSLTSDDGVVKKDFMRRMELLSLKHENIAKLLGLCQEEDPMYLISEYPEQGDLKTVMRDSSSPLSPTQKLNICAAVASGMNYLTNHGHVHKDLAARNCLVNKSFAVKISFLSLNQGTYPKEYYKHKGELIPLRWMAPEALEGDYSDMSDVWAFGILMWEVYTEGILPYEERPDEEVLHSVADDLRLTKPEGCPGKIYKMMEKCWADDKEDRLTFGQLCEDISEIPRESDF